MSAAQLKNQAKTLIDQMSPAQLRVANEFLSFMKSREVDAETAELLAIPGFQKSFAKGLRDVKAGRTTRWREVRRDVITIAKRSDAYD